MQQVLKARQVYLNGQNPFRASIALPQLRGFLGAFTKQDIKFETKKVVPYSAHHFFNVIKDVDGYQEFIPWITQSRVLPESVIIHPGNTSGRFDGEVKIGFSSLSFAYVSRVSYERDDWILSEAGNSRVFEGLYSHWKLQKLSDHQCEITYNIKMTFANPLYTAVTTQFFDYLANNINKAFEKRCYDKYYKDGIIEVESFQQKVQDGGKLCQSDDVVAQSQEKKSKQYMPEDNWVWEVGQASKASNSKNLQGNEDLRQKKRRELLESISQLTNSGFITSSLDIQLLGKALEKEEDLYRELKTLHEAFGEQNSVYARHVARLMIEHGCVLAK